MTRWAAKCSDSGTGPRVPTVNGSGVLGVVVEEEGARGQQELLALQGETIRMLRCWAPGAGAVVAERGCHPGGHPPPGGEHLGAQGARGQGGN